MSENQPMTKLETFHSWHREPSLYREIYARTTSTLIAALAIAIVAGIAGFVPLGVFVTALGLAVMGVASFLALAVEAQMLREYYRAAKVMVKDRTRVTAHMRYSTRRLIGLGLRLIVLFALLSVGLGIALLGRHI